MCRWVQQQAAQAADQLWVAGVKEYFRHADKLLEDFDDVLANGEELQKAGLSAVSLKHDK